MAVNLSTLTTNTTSQLNVLRHDGDTLCMDSAQVGIFEQADKVRLCSFLQGKNCGALETKIRLEILRDFPHKTLERQFTDEQVGRFLIATDFTKRDGTGSVAVRLLHSSGDRGGLAGGLGGELLARRLSASGLASGLLGARHQEGKAKTLRVANGDGDDGNGNVHCVNQQQEGQGKRGNT